jgi:hypothetical protein
MTRATDLTDSIETALAEIAPGDFSTNIRAIYGVGAVKPDAAPLPCLLVRIESDESLERVGVKVKRSAQYHIEGVFPRTATLQELQLCHHDILKALGYGQNLPGRPLKPGWAGEDSAQFDLGGDGSTHRTVTAMISIDYIETY